MANREHLKILEQGVETWNRWREQNPATSPDLSHASPEDKNLSGVNLTTANLTGANLIKANLTGANLSGAYIYGANLTRSNLVDADVTSADLSEARLDSSNLNRAKLNDTCLYNAILFGANLEEASLRNSDLRSANLRSANLTCADLSRANLSGSNLHDSNLRMAELSSANLGNANLTGANLYSAILMETIFANTDLSAATGLDYCEHDGPSVLDLRTLQRSGPLPEPFLRGCGLPDIFIKYLPSLLNSDEAAVQFYSCFISYSSKDDEFSRRLHSRLREAHVSVWFAPEDLKIGDKLRPRIDEVIRIYDKLLIVLSKDSVVSDWVEHEVETALAREQEQKKVMLFPIRLDDAVMEIKTGWQSHVRTRHIGDFRNWKKHDDFEKAFDRLLRDLKATSKKP